MAQIDKNTVKADNQLKGNSVVFFDNIEGNGKRIQIFGNSITRHSPLAEIGWHNDWGMAASSIDKDYVHILEKKIWEKDKDAAFCICQIASWEQNYVNGETRLSEYETGENFGADIMIFRIIENCPHKDFKPDLFKKEFRKMVSFFDKKGTAKKIIASGFWKHPGDEQLKEIAEEMGADFIYLGDLGEEKENRADGLFEHAGVAAHPGDKGMQAIADMIFEKAEKYL
ncbi:MAG: hypothetical protein Q4B31_02220 [Clostridia bacterium]|nr:hypothetical protein [Clostridia bacterium]